MPIEDALPVRPARNDVEIFDEEANDGLDRHPAGRQVELVQIDGVVLAVGVDVRSCDSAAVLGVPVERRNWFVAAVDQVIDPARCSCFPEALPTSRRHHDVAVGQRQLDW